MPLLPVQPSTRRLRVLAADEDREALDETTAVLEQLGHEVTSHAVRVDEAARRIADDDPDLSVVMLHGDDEHALELIEQLTEWTSGPVIALLEEEDNEFVKAAAERGIDACARPVTPEAVHDAIEIAVRRHGERRRLTEEVEQLRGALERRAVIERAKGILMERHGVDDRAAFELLRSHARSSNRTVVDLADAVLAGHALLPPKA